jgi:4-amino-4-deoxy-L-arabinose transferase-like glycosyltransferase
VKRKWILGLLLGLLLLSAALVWHDLGAREVLGRDENATIAKLDQPSLKAAFDATQIKITGEPGNMQPLYFVAQYLFWPVVGRSSFMLRFLPSICGLLAVLLTYKLGEALFSREVGLVGALLTALLPLHIRYAQIARPYTLLALFSLASAYFLVRALKTNRILHWAGFVLAATLNFYTHYNALFVLVAEGLFAGLVWLGTLIAVLKQRQSPGQLVRPALSFVGVGLLCTPGLIRLLRLPWLGLEGGAEPESDVTVELAVPFFRHFLYESGLSTAWLQNLLAGLIALGVVGALYRRRWQAALFSVLWLAVPFVTLAAMRSPRPFEERYVIFVMPVALLLAGQGVVAMGEWLAVLGRRWNERAVRWAVTLPLAIAVVWLFAGLTRAYYVNNLDTDRLEQTLVVVEHNARPGDVVVVSPRFFVRPLAVDGAEVLYLTAHLSPAELDDLALRHQRMWILYTSYFPTEKLQEPLDQWVRARPDRFVRVPIKAINALAFGTTSPTDAEVEFQDRIAVLEELAQNSAGKGEAWQRYGLLADAYLALADLYASRGEATLAAEYRQRAEETRAAAPPP